MQHSAAWISSGVLPTKTSIESPHAAACRRAISAWWGLYAATANRTPGTAARTCAAALRNQGKLCVTSWVREPGRIVTSGPEKGQVQFVRSTLRAVPANWTCPLFLRQACQESLVELVAGNIVKERVADQRGIAPVLAEPRLLKRQAAKDVVHQPTHLPDSPLGPRPDLRRGIIKDRDAVGLGPPGNPPVHSGIVDQHHGVGAVMPEILAGPDDQVPELVQVDQHPGEPHHGQGGQVGMEAAAGSGHVRAAVADRLQTARNGPATGG